MRGQEVHWRYGVTPVLLRLKANILKFFFTFHKMRSKCANVGELQKEVENISAFFVASQEKFWRLRRILC
jgi:hypothetical protein